MLGSEMKADRGRILPETDRKIAQLESVRELIRFLTKPCQLTVLTCMSDVEVKADSVFARRQVGFFDP
jgi:hypothetical protein